MTEAFFPPATDAVGGAAANGGAATKGGGNRLAVRVLRPLWVTTLTYGLLFCAGLVLAAIAIDYVAVRSLVADVDARLATESRAILGEAPDTPLGEIRRRIAERQWHMRDDDLGYLLVTGAGAPISGNIRLRVPPAGLSDVDYLEGWGKPDRGRALAVKRRDGSVLVLVADYGPVEDLNAKLIWIGGLSLAATIVIGAVAGMAMTASISRRIEATSRIAESIMAGDLKQRMPFDGSGGAFDRQAAVLNRMLDRIEALMEQLRQVSADVAHDLRIPLSVLRNKLLALSEREPVLVSADEVEGLLAQSEALLALFAAILRISEVESGSRRDRFGEVDLLRMATELAATFAPFADDQAKSLQVGAGAAATVEGDAELLSQAIINLLENALKYTAAGTRIRLIVENAGDGAVIKVADDGPGIAPGDRGRALRRFGRLDGSRSLPGNGLGLSLVEAIARLHGGRFTLDDAGPGLVAAIWLPRIAAPE